MSQKPGSFPGGYDAPPKPGSEKAAGEAFAPYRPPSEYLDNAEEFMNEDDNMSLMRLRQRAGNWFQLAPLFPKLMRAGFMPDDIFDETGIEPKEQSLWATWTAARGSLVSDPRFPDEKLEYFTPEWNAETLSAIQYLPSEKRAPFSEFVVDNEFNLEQTKELVKSVEIRAAHDSQAKGFGTGPGECMAFKMWRDVQEVQRYEGLARVVELVEKGKKYATEASTCDRLDALVEMWRIDLAEGSDLMEGGLMGKANAAGNAKIQAVRLDAEELAFKPVPMLGPLEKLQPAAVIAVEEIKPNGSSTCSSPSARSSGWRSRRGRRSRRRRCLSRCSSETRARCAAPATYPTARSRRCSSWTKPIRPPTRRRSTSPCASRPSSSPAAAAPRSSTCSAGRRPWPWNATGRVR